MSSVVGLPTKCPPSHEMDWSAKPGSPTVPYAGIESVHRSFGLFDLKCDKAQISAEGKGEVLTVEESVKFEQVTHLVAEINLGSRS